MFCPKCGSKNIVDIFCANCLQEEKPLVASFKECKIDTCITCHRVHHKGRWNDSSILELIKRCVKPAQDVHIEHISAPDVQPSYKPGLKDSGEIILTVTGRSSKKAKPHTETFDFPYEINNRLCPHCQKLGTQYFEATLQVRNETPASHELLNTTLAKYNASTAKTVRHKNGTDYLITSKTVTEKIAHLIHEKLGATFKISAKLFTRNKQTSKEVHRMTYFVELPPFKKGDVVTNGKNPLVVKDISKKIRFFNLVKNKTAYYEYKDFTWQILPTFETSISSLKPLTIIHPETFQATPVSNPQEAHDPVTITIFNNKVYLIPT